MQPSDRPNRPSVTQVPRKPYRSPRDWLPQDKYDQFGVAEEPDWLVPSDDLERILLEAAQKQHSLAIGIRTRRDRRRLKTEDLARMADLAPSTVRNILNGTKHADLPVLYALTDAVALELKVTARPERPAREVEEGDP